MAARYTRRECGAFRCPFEKGHVMWAYESVFYQIYPIGFCGAPREAPAVGDEAACEAERAHHRIRRVASWAPYLERLGVEAVLLNPVFEASGHGYDTRDLTCIDCRLGTNEDVRAVVDELHAHGIRVVLDAVFNHVGREFWAFRDVRERRWDSPYKDWFCINFEGDSAFGDGFWYEGWEGIYELVKLNLRNPAVVDYLLDCVRAWRRDLGIDGLRLDVAYALDRDFMRRLHGVAAELSAEDPVGAGEASGLSAAAAASPAARIAADRRFVLIGETLHGDYSQLVNPELLDSCTNYECYKGLYSSFNSQNMFEIAHSLHRQFGGDPWCIYRGLHLLSFADNHDVTRLASILTDARCLRPAYGLLFGMPGIPCIYYGSEWGQEGTKGAHDDFDLRPAFEEPLPNELTAWIARLAAARTGRAAGAAVDAALRAGARALCYGSYRNVVITNKQLLFERAAEACDAAPAARVLVAVNAVDEPFELHADELRGAFVDLLAASGAADGADGDAQRAAADALGTAAASADAACGAGAVAIAEDAPAAALTLDGSLSLAPFETRYLLAWG